MIGGRVIVRNMLIQVHYHIACTAIYCTCINVHYVPQQLHSQVCPTHTAAGIACASKTPGTEQLKVARRKERGIHSSHTCTHSLTPERHDSSKHHCARIVKQQAYSGKVTRSFIKPKVTGFITEWTHVEVLAIFSITDLTTAG